MKGKVKKGNDGHKYVSKRTSNGVYRWSRVTSSSKKPVKRSPVKKTTKKPVKRSPAKKPTRKATKSTRITVHYPRIPVGDVLWALRAFPKYSEMTPFNMKAATRIFKSFPTFPTTSKEVSRARAAAWALKTLPKSPSVVREAKRLAAGSIVRRAEDKINHRARLHPSAPKWHLGMGIA
jgi:hypothetical protein